MACHAFFSWLADYRNEEKGMFLNKTKQKIKRDEFTYSTLDSSHFLHLDPLIFYLRVTIIVGKGPLHDVV